MYMQPFNDDVTDDKAFNFYFEIFSIYYRVESIVYPLIKSDH